MKNFVIEQFHNWFNKTVRTIEVTKGEQGKQLLNRMQTIIESKESMKNFSLLSCITMLKYILEANKAATLSRHACKRAKWLVKLEKDTQIWENILTHTLQNENESEDDIISHVISNKLDIEKAISLFQTKV